MVRNQGGRKPKGKKLDLLFIQDTTESQQDYIESAVIRCKDVCFALRSSGQLDQKDGLRLGVLAFRDLEASDEYVTKDFDGFTYDVDKVVANLSSLTAKGGGDGAEAVAAALDAAAKMPWRNDAVKIAVLITDAPPHGIGEREDDYWDGEPNGKDPLNMARAMARRGICLLLIACEPELSNEYDLAHDFYQALVRLTAGLMIPLTDANLLAPIIIGFAFEQVQLDALITEFSSFILKSHKEGTPAAEIAKKLQEILKSRGQTIISADTTPVYKEPPEAQESIKVWMKAKDTPAGRDALLGVAAQSRVPEEFTPPPKPWPKYPVGIWLVNRKDFFIFYTYSEQGVEKTGVLEPGQVGPKPTTFLVNEPYNFSLKVGSRIVPASRTFTAEGDFEMSRYFD